MSLVGTRPPTLDEWEKYEPHHRARMSFRPGLTGLWQVSGRSNITDFEEVVKLDTQYIGEWSVKGDIKIILQTVLGVVKNEKQIARQLNIVMSRMISILDTKAPDAMKENFYHGLLLGLLRGSNPDWLIKSNRESGDGFSDILIMPEDPDAGIVIEVKYARTYPRYRRQEKWWKGHGNRWYCYVNYYHRTCSYQCYCWCLSANIKCLESVIIT